MCRALIIGAGGVGTVVAQKVAANNSNRSQAKLLAQSAISRIATAIMYYQYEASKSGIIPLNYSDIYSYGKDKNGTIFADGLFSTDDSLLMPPSSATIDLPDASTLQNPKWAFVFDKPESESDRKNRAELRFAWTPSALYLAVTVHKEQFHPEERFGKMAIWRGDSLQIGIDTMKNAVRETKGLQSDDFEYEIGEFRKRPLVWRQKASSATWDSFGKATGEVEDVKLAIRHLPGNPWLQTDRCEDERYTWLHDADF